MEIDWFTFFAQMVNFLILVGLLWRFLYRPIVDAMDQRQKGIADRVAEAEQREREAKEQITAYEQKQRELAQKREQMLAEAREEADQRRKELIEKARSETDKMKEQWKAAVEQEKESFLKDLRVRAGQQVCEATRRVLHDLADAELESRLAGAFVDRLGELSDDDCKALSEAAREADGRIEVRSAFELAQEARERVSGAVRDRLDGAGEVQFSQVSDLVGGIELKAGSRKVAWTIDAYLQDMTQRMQAAMEQ